MLPMTARASRQQIAEWHQISPFLPGEPQCSHHRRRDHCLRPSNPGSATRKTAQKSVATAAFVGECLDCFRKAWPVSKWLLDHIVERR